MTTGQTSNDNKSTQPGFLSNMKIGTKLALGFGILVFFTFLSAGVSYLGSYFAANKIESTDDVRVPTALMASKAQADLLRMQADVRGYLALGDQLYRERYIQSSLAFENDLVELEKLSHNLGEADNLRLDELSATYNQWAELPEKLFELRDDQLDREPAYRLLATEGIEYAGQVLIATNTMIEKQGTRPATEENLELLEDMAKFQGNFAAMLSSLRGYVTTRNRIYRGEYEVNQVDNDYSWERLSSQKSKLTASQQELLTTIETNRQAFLQMPEEIFEILEGPRWREDLYLFQTEALPLTEKMRQSLDELTGNQQSLLRNELASGRQDLTTANMLILASGIVALIMGLVMAVISRATIAMPIQRVTSVAEQISAGDLEAQAPVASKDEIGILATAFNTMTSKLRLSLLQVRKEKKRADDLLEVVIPIGVELTTEKDFNRLLEKMLVEAKTFCNADAGALYLRTDEDNNLKYVIVRNDSQQVYLGGTTGSEIPFLPIPLVDPTTAEPNHRHVASHVALSGATSNVADITQTDEFDFFFSHEDGNHLLSDYQIRSLLTIPLRNSQDQVLGVLQLINAQEPASEQIVPFDPNLQQMMESFSSLAVAALEAYIREQSLRQEIQQLRIEIDEAKRQKQVEEIVSTDFFQHISTRAQDLRKRRRSKK